MFTGAESPGALLITFFTDTAGRPYLSTTLIFTTSGASQTSLDPNLMNRPLYYRLNEHGEPVGVTDSLVWGESMKSQNRIVAQEWVGDHWVSTVFLGLDHNHAQEGPPVLWETMVFNGPLNQEMDRCAGAREQAEKMHAEMLTKVKAYEKARAN